MRNAITYFEIMLPRLSAHDAQIFVARMGVMLQCCQPAGDIFPQDSYTQARAALLVLAPCKTEIEQEATRHHVANVPLEQAYTALHMVLEARPSLTSDVLHEIAGLVSSLDKRRDEWKHQERLRKEADDEHEVAKNKNIERLEKEDKARMAVREALRTKMLARMNVQEEANTDRGFTHERVGRGEVGEKRRVGDERGCFMCVWTRQFISN